MTVYCSLLTLTDKSLLSVTIILKPNVVLHDLNTTLLIVMMWITIRPATVLYVNSTSGYIQTDIMMTC